MPGTQQAAVIDATFSPLLRMGVKAEIAKQKQPRDSGHPAAPMRLPVPSNDIDIEPEEEERVVPPPNSKAELARAAQEALGELESLDVPSEKMAALLKLVELAKEG